MDWMKVRYGFLDGMKAIVCLFVFLGHYFVAFFIKDVFPMNSIPYRACILVFYGCYTVPLFCAISGFLAMQKELGKGWNLVLATLNRFLRFEIPIVVVIAAVMLLNRRELFACGDLLAQRLENKQLAGNYAFESHYTWLYRKPFWDFQSYNSPLWMTGSLFAGNIALYCYSYTASLCRRYLKGPASAVCQMAAMALLFFLARHDIPLFAVLLGGCYALLRQWAGGMDGRHNSGRKAHAFGCAAGLLLMLLNAGLYFFRDFDFERFPRYYEWVGMAAACGILHLVFSIPAVQGLLEGKALAALGKLSFAIYIVHYPLIGLLACPMVYILWDRLPYVPLVLLAFTATAAACLIASIVFNRLIERPCYAGIKKVIGFLGEN